LRRGEHLPGFGQPLYPEGDPRGAELLRLAHEVRPEHPAVGLADAVVEAVQGLIGERPTIDFGLVTLSQTLGFPEGAPLALFSIGRTVGWLAHVMEQYQEDQLIRPRARYVGVEPPTSRNEASELSG
jgi:citrate synthase